MWLKCFKKQAAASRYLSLWPEEVQILTKSKSNPKFIQSNTSDWWTRPDGCCDYYIIYDRRSWRRAPETQTVTSITGTSHSGMEWIWGCTTGINLKTIFYPMKEKKPHCGKRNLVRSCSPWQVWNQDSRMKHTHLNSHCARHPVHSSVMAEKSAGEKFAHSKEEQWSCERWLWRL